MRASTNNHSTVIIGGGWAGLSAAIHLANKNVPVTLIEAAEQPGGRARMVMFGDLPVDNGQHIALGAYRNFLEVLKIIGVDEAFVLSRLPLSLTVKGSQGTVSLTAPKLPAPLHLLLAFLKADGLSAGDKIKTMANWLRLIGTRARSDMTVTDLMHCTGQSERVTHYLWTPLCIAAMNTHPDIASARVFQRVLKDAFMRRRADSDILLPRYDMGRLFPQPAMDWLIGKGVNVMTGQRVSRIETRDNRVTGVTVGNMTIATGQLIIATNPWSCASLIEPIDSLSSLHRDISQFNYEPIATVYLKYSRAVLLNPTMQGLADSSTQWIFDRRITSHPKIVAAVISADGEHASMSKEELVQTVVNDIKANTDLQDDPIDSLVIREKRATFSATPHAETLRPNNKTALNGCWLAGDYTATGYPATLEGAIISGKAAAIQILAGNTP
ncbi:MAG: hydroxysqualene dehydroxylase HpnE [Gammaproteobacteria bacterium]|nr:hydroxysqualene dehydroxylase HpnE [Gammaproteobacteria bacterium]